MMITKRHIVLVVALFSLKACLSVEGVPKSASVSYVVRPHVDGQAQVQATMSALSLAPNRVRLLGDDHFFVQTSLVVKKLERDDEPLKVFLQGSVYSAIIDAQKTATMGLMRAGEKSFLASVDILPSIVISAPENRLYSDVVPLQWNSQGQYDSARVDLYCTRSVSQSKVVNTEDEPLPGAADESTRDSQRFGFNLDARTVATGQLKVNVSRVKALISQSDFTLNQCQPRLQVWRSKPGRFLKGKGLLNGQLLDSVMFKDYQYQNFQVNEPPSR